MLPRTTATQRARFYTDVESLISPGFLTHAVKVAGVRFQMRSLSPGDLFMLRARAEGANTHEWRLWMVASSIWMVNGISVLGQDDVVPLLAESLRSLPFFSVRTLFSILLGLFARAQKAVRAVGTYCYESESRFRWATSGKEHNPLFAGVPGSECLGLNAVQQMWVAFNQFEDRRLESDLQWDGFKLVASSNSPKAIKKLDEKDRQRLALEVDRREKAMDAYFYFQMGVITEEEQLSGGGQRFQGVKSVEDLEEEMRRWVTGDADLHDSIVNDYKAQIHEQVVRREQEQEARRLALQQERERQMVEAAASDFKPQPLLALTATQLQQILRERGSSLPPGVRFIPTGAQQTADRLYAPYVKPESQTPGVLQVVDGKVVDPASNDTDMRTLNQLIQGRHPVFGSGE